MKNILVVGPIAGVVLGTVSLVTSYIFGLHFRILEAPGGLEIWDPSLVRLFALATLSLGVIWGTIMGVIYAKFYDRVPGKGILKGLYFGLIIWLIKDIMAGSYLALTMLEIPSAIILLINGFFMWPAYGLVLGFLYKPTK
jgi:hypothetical protein